MFGYKIKIYEELAMERYCQCKKDIDFNYLVQQVDTEIKKKKKIEALIVYFT